MSIQVQKSLYKYVSEPIMSHHNPHEGVDAPPLSLSLLYPHQFFPVHVISTGIPGIQGIEMLPFSILTENNHKLLSLSVPFSLQPFQPCMLQPLIAPASHNSKLS